MELSYQRKKGLKDFWRRHKHQVFGCFLLAGILAIWYIGWRQAHPKEVVAEEAVTEKADMGAYMGFDKLGLGYDVSMDGIDGEMFDYSVYFDHEVTQADRDAVSAEIDKLYENYDEDAYYGDISLWQDESFDKEKVVVVLDLGNADDGSMITDILEAIDRVDGVSRVVINEGADEY